MAKILGIDYGTKRVGIAMSDETGTLAFPKEVLINDKNIFARIKSLCEEEKTASIVLGESKDFKGIHNPISEKIVVFKKNLEIDTGLSVYLQEEFLTSVEARRVENSPEFRDAHAAAFILQRYLDKNNA